MRSAGISFFASTSVRQSNDCSVVRSTSPEVRIASTTMRAKVAGSTVSSGASGRQLGFEVEPHRRGRPRRQGEQLLEQRDALAVDGDLLRKLAGVARGRVDAAHVVAAQLRDVEVSQARPGRGDPASVRPTREHRIEVAVVREDRDTVARDADVRLQRRDADRERLAERRHRVLGRETPGTAVALEVERAGGRRVRGEQGGGEGGEAEHPVDLLTRGRKARPCP